MSRDTAGRKLTTITVDGLSHTWWAVIVSCNEELCLESRVSREDVYTMARQWLEMDPERRSVSWVDVM